MKILIIGTGGTGGALGGFLAADNHDVSFIARGEHLNAMKLNNLKIISPQRGDFVIENTKASTAEDYSGVPDVIFVCVKGYSLEDAEILIRRVATKDTVIIPILNVINTGESLRTKLPTLNITDGCIHVAARISSPGVITIAGGRFRVVFGNPDGSVPENLKQIEMMLQNSKIKAVASDNIKRDCFQKLAMVSPLASIGSYYNAPVGKIKENPHMMKDFLDMTAEIISIAEAAGLKFTVDMIESNKKIIMNSADETTTSLHRDILKGGASEIEGLVFEVVEMGKRYGVKTPVYQKVAEFFGYSAT